MNPLQGDFEDLACLCAEETRYCLRIYLLIRLLACLSTRAPATSRRKVQTVTLETRIDKLQIQQSTSSQLYQHRLAILIVSCDS